MAIKVKSATVRPSQISTSANWPTVRFGDVVRDVKLTVDRETTDLTRFIAGEHMGSEDLHLRTWGDINENYLGPAFHRLFRKGQVLYGSRRTYLKKVAVASFDGICANTTFVLESRDPNFLLPDLLPFIMLTDGFTQHSIRESKGSVNPYINWKDIAKYEFPLPPKDEQRRIAEILWTADEACEHLLYVVASSSDFSTTLVSHMWKNGISPESRQETVIGPIPASWKVAPLADFTVESAYGPRFSGNEYSPTGNVQSVRTTDFDRRGGLTLATAPFANLPNDVISKHRLLPGDFLLSRTGEYAGLTATFKESSGCYVAAAFLIRFHLDSKRLLSDYLVNLCYSDFGKRFVLRLVTGSAQPNINGSDMLALKIPVPPLDVQRRIIQMADQAKSTVDAARSNLNSCKHLARTIANELLLTRIHAFHTSRTCDGP
ncbi:MAG TPA: hypothetical protein DDZ51_29750 [Planctomycetaceae bacterium]|nr:hypothetical protein [Planctomycetaceae bacterium]